MKNKIILCCLVGLVSLTLSNRLYASDYGVAILQPIKFGKVLPIIGRCEMSFETGIFSSDLSNTCPVLNGRPGEYRIVAPRNTLVRITPYTFTYAVNMFTFTAKGKVSNSTVTKFFTANNATIIDSGATGVIDMKIGGILNVMSPLTTSNSYPVDLEIDIVVMP